jgi:hypothetical protein
MLVSEIIAKIKSRVDDDDIATDFLLDAINSVYFRILNDTQTFWKFLEGTTTFSTVAGTTDYSKATIAADLNRIYNLSTSNNKVYPIAQRDFDEYVPDPSAEGNIAYYMEWGDTLKLYPIPSGIETVNVRYYKKVTTPLVEANTPIIPIEYQELLIMGGMMAYYEQDEDFDRLDRKTKEYEVMLARMRRSDESEIDRTYTLKRRSKPVPFMDYTGNRW